MHSSRVAFLVLCILLTACQVNLTAQPVPEDLTVDGWQPLAAGLLQRTLQPFGDPFAQLQVIRIDPAVYTFRAHYRAGAPLNLNAWREQLPDAAVIVNANFFDVQHEVLGLLVSDGSVYGRAYTERGGTFAVEADGVRVWSNYFEPYRGQPIQQAVQAFPMLMVDGVQFNRDTRQTRRSRRTVIAQDEQGQILVMATPSLGIGLFALSEYLPTTPLNIVNAFALDGGGSTMMYIAANGYTLSSFDPVPSVLAAYPRDQE